MVDFNSSRDEFTEMLEGMTKQELVRYARLTYGLSLTIRLNKPDLTAAIKSAASQFKGNEQLQSASILENEDLRPGYAEIQLHRTESNKGQRAAIVGLNGRMSSLPIGTKFGCPLELLAILQNAMRIEYDVNPEDNELEEREVHSYPFTIHRINPHTPDSYAQAGKLRGLKKSKVRKTKVQDDDAQYA